MRFTNEKCGVGNARRVLGVFLLATAFCLLAPCLTWAQGNSVGKYRNSLELPSQDAPTCLSVPASLVVTCYDGNVYFGGGKVAAGDSSGTALTMTASMSTCPTTGACNFIYSDNSGVLHTTTTLATAYTATTAPLYFVTTSATAATIVQPAWRQTLPFQRLIDSVLGVVTATSINGITVTAGTGTLTITGAKTVTFNSTSTFTGTDSQTYTFPTTSATLARTDAANTFTGVQTMTAPVISAPVVTRGTTAVGPTLSPTCAAQSGQVILMGAATGEVVTLPAAGAGTVGCTFDFIVTVTDTSNFNEIQTTGSNYLLGEVQECASGVACLDFWADGSSTKALKMGQTTTGGFLGSHFHVVGISATQWAISGTELGSGTMITAFTGTP